MQAAAGAFQVRPAGAKSGMRVVDLLLPIDCDACGHFGRVPQGDLRIV